MATHFPPTSFFSCDSSSRQPLYFVLSHCDGQSRHGPCSIACVTATGTPSRGMKTKMRRVAMPSSAIIPVAIGFSPRKSKISHPSRFDSASARCTAATESRVSISGSLRMSGPPFCAPLTTFIAALETLHVIDGTTAVNQQADQLAKCGGVVLASRSVCCAVGCHGIFHGQTDEIFLIFERASKKSARNLANVRERELASNDRGSKSNDSS